MSSTILEKSVSQVVKLLKNGAVSSHQILDEAYQRLEKTKCLNTFISVCPKEQNQQILNDNVKSSLLKGIPFSLKDNFSTKGVHTTCGSYMLKDYVPAFNSTVAEKLIAAGGIMIGKTNLDEFAMGSGSVDSLFGAVRNPWLYDFNDENPSDWFVSGGSSGGSAVAVTTGASYFAVGSDTGGSVRVPAAWCGIVGLKPTYGTISRHGLISLVNSMDTPGIFARRVDDAAFIYNILCGRDVLDSTSVNRKMKPIEIKETESVKDLVVGIPKEYHGSGLCREILEAWDKTADMFCNAGAKVVEVSMPHTQYSIVCYHVLCCGEIASNMARYDGIEYGHRSTGSFTEELYAKSRNEGFNEVVRGRIMAGNFFLLKENYETYYDKALKVRRLIANDFRNVYSGGVDVLLTPTCASTSTLHSEFTNKSNRDRTAEHDVYTQTANLSGIPAVSVPVRLSKQGLPISLQLMANCFNEEKLLQTAKFLEAELNFPCFKFDKT